MNWIILKIRLVALFICFNSVVFAQKVQIIHNCPSSEAEKVDIYLNGTKVLDDFGFRQYTKFLDVPPGNHTVVIASGASTGVDDQVLVTAPLSLAPSDVVYAVATGLVNPSQYAPNPDGEPTGLKLLVRYGARMFAEDPSEVDLYVYHGATDVPTVNVREENFNFNIIEQIKYTDGAILSVIPLAYKIGVRVSTTNALIQDYLADVSTWTGKAAFIFATGFAKPEANQNGAPFGLYVALANPTETVNDAIPLVPASEAPVAKLQLIHNAPGNETKKVDIYVNDIKVLNDFGFRQYTQYLEVPAGSINVKIGAETSSGPGNQILYTTTLNVEGDKNYRVMATGLVNPSNYVPNPDGLATAFALKVIENAPLQASSDDTVAFSIVHTSTDAPTVNLQEEFSGNAILTNVSYMDAAPLEINTGQYRIGVRKSAGNSLVSAYELDLTESGGQAGTIMASGFITPSTNQNGPAFGLFACLAAPPSLVNDAVPLPLVALNGTAKAQLIHNSAGIEVKKVDIYVNGNKVLDDFPYQAYTNFGNLPAGEIKVSINHQNSNGVNDMVFAQQTLLVGANDHLQVIATGVPLPNEYKPNIDDIPTNLKLHIIPNALMDAPGNFTNVTFVQGCTDIFRYNLQNENTSQVLVNSFKYDSHEKMLLPAEDFVIGVRVTLNNTMFFGYKADLAQFSDKAVTILASGFLDNQPENQSAAPFGLYLALAEPAGDINVLVPLQIPTTRTKEIAQGSSIKLYPNPTADLVTLQHNLPGNQNVHITLIDALGKEVYSQSFTTDGTNTLLLNVMDVVNGVYTFDVKSDSQVVPNLIQKGKLVIVK